MCALPDEVICASRLRGCASAQTTRLARRCAGCLRTHTRTLSASLDRCAAARNLRPHSDCGADSAARVIRRLRDIGQQPQTARLPPQLLPRCVAHPWRDRNGIFLLRSGGPHRSDPAGMQSGPPGRRRQHPRVDRRSWVARLSDGAEERRSAHTTSLISLPAAASPHGARQTKQADDD